MSALRAGSGRSSSELSGTSALGLPKSQGCARHIGRVGALAVALGVGIAVASSPGVAWATTDGTNATSVDNGGTPGASAGDQTSEAGSHSPSTEQGSTGTAPEGGTTPGSHSGTDLGNGVVISAQSSTAVPKKGKHTATAKQSRKTPTSVSKPAATANGKAPASPQSSSSTSPRTRTVQRHGAATVSTPAVTSARVAAPSLAAKVVPTGPSVSAVQHPVASLVATPVAAISTVLHAVSAALLGGGPGTPEESPAMWVLAAAARRQFGQTDSTANTLDSIRTSQSLALAAAANQAPTARYSAGSPNFSTGVVKGRVTATDKDRDPLTYGADALSAKGGAVGIDDRGRFTYTPTATARHAASATTATAADRVDTFTATVDDGQGHTVAVLVTVKLSAVNAAPKAAGTVGQPNPVTGAVTGQVTATDRDNDTLTYTASAPRKGSVVVNGDGTFTYTPTAAARETARKTFYADTDRFRITVDDGHGGVKTVALTATIAPAQVVTNNPPVANNDSYSTAEDAALNVTGPGILGNDTDADGNTLIAGSIVGPSHGSLSVFNDGSFSYIPNANFNGTDSFTYKATDGTATSASATVTITVTPVNDAPVANNESYSTAEDTALNVTGPGILGNDTDVDSANLTATKVTDPAHGTVTVNANGSFTYTPNANYNGADSFTYRTSDGTATSTAATVNLTVTAVNDAPVATGDSYTTTRDVPLTVSGPGLLANDTDVDSANLTATKVTDPAHGTVTVNANGSFTYTPNANYSGADSFTYRVSDGTAASAAATVSLTVTPVVVVTSPSTVGAPDYSVIVGSTGTLFQVTSDFNPASGVPTATRVSVVNADGQVLSTTSTIAGGIGIAAPVARPDGTLVLATYDQPNNVTTVTSVSTSGVATTLGTAPGIPLPFQVAANGTMQSLTASVTGPTPTYGVLTVSPDNSVHAYAIDGMFLTLPQLAPDGSAYLVVTKSDTATNTSTARLLAVAPDGTTRLSPGFTTAGVAGTGGVVIASDGTAFATFSVPNLQTGTYTTSVVTATASTLTTRTIANTLGNGLLVAGGQGAVYQAVQNGATLNSVSSTVSIAKITAGDITLTAPVSGLVTSQVVIGAAGTAFVNIIDQTQKNSVLVRLETGEVVTVVIPGTISTYHSGVGQGTIITTGGQAHTYVPYTKSLADGGVQAYVAVITFSGTVSQSSVTLPAGVSVDYPVVFGPGLSYTPYQLVTNAEDGTTSVVNLTNGASTVPQAGLPFNGGGMSPGLSKSLYFAPNGLGYLLTTEGSGSSAVTSVLAFNGDTGGAYTGVSAPGNPSLTAPMVAGAAGFSADPIVFASGGTAYVTTQNGAGIDPHPSVVVYEITPNGATKVLDEDDAIGSPVTVAPDGTVYVSIGKLNATGDDYVTTVRVISSAAVV